MIEIPNDGAAYFASDLHLSETTPRTLEAFENWLASVACENAMVFLLGDLFEVWFGDDHSDNCSQRVIESIQHATAAGARVFFMHGNRDFLVGESFSETSGAELLPDPDFLRVKSHVVLLSHGDQLCTDDTAYQAFRRQSRDEKWQSHFLALPIEKRMEMARAIRSESKMHKANSALSIMDANQSAIAAAFNGQWPDGCYIGKNDVLLHGHTHRCAIHETIDSAAPAHPQSTSGFIAQGMRIVLPDWNFDEPATGQPKGGFLKMQADGYYSLNLFN